MQNTKCIGQQCLNMMRQAMHQDYYNNPDFPEQQAPVFTDRPFTVKMHLRELPHKSHGELHS
jgi:hypothetical protein